MSSAKNTLILLLLLMICLQVSAQHIGEKVDIDPFHYSIQKDATGKNGSVVCAHPLAAKVGLDILMQGGNAIDATIATQLALAVVYPEAGNIGGGGFMLARWADGKAITLDYRETASAAASADMYVDKATGKPDMDLSQAGHLAAGVPGTVAGLFAAMKYAKLPFKTLIQPAIELAEHGFVITQREADNLNATAAEFEKYNTVIPVVVKKNGAWKAGDTLVQKDLANTLKRVRDNGEKGFYEGETAALIVAEMKRGRGIITLADLKGYAAKERSPITFTYKGYEIVTMPPPSSGGILLEQMLKMLENRPLPQYGFHSLKSVQLITEVERRAYADRAKYFGDPDFYNVPVDSLVNDAYLQQRMANYDSTQAGNSTVTREGSIKEHDQTTHFCVIDKEGNCVSVTTTLNGWYGSKTFVGGAGFLLNNEMDDFSVQPGAPNMYGAVGGKANAIAPHKRMLSSMTPTIVLRNGKPYMIVGTPGGTTITTSVLQCIVDAIDYHMSPHDIVNSPKFHHQWLPDRIDVEADFPQDVQAQLQQMGYKINQRKAWGAVELIKIDSDGHITSAADKRGNDDAEGY